MRRLSLALLLAAGTLLAGPSLVGAAPAPVVGHDPAATEAGTYNLDVRHASLLAKLAHQGGVSVSVFRFEKMSGTLDWNPAQPTASKLNITVDMKSINSPVPGFGDELGGPTYLNTAQYPTATFVSTSAVQTAPGKGKVTGNLTFFGQTRPATFDVELVGTGGNARGKTLGFHAVGSIKRSDFGFSAMAGPIGDQVGLEFDAEFMKPNPPAPGAAAPAAPAAPPAR